MAKYIEYGGDPGCVSLYLHLYFHESFRPLKASFDQVSVSGSEEVLGDGDDVLLAVSGILGLSIAHWHVFAPDSDENGLSGFGDASTTTSLSGEDAVFDSIVFIGLQKHVLLVADSDSAFLSSRSFSTGGLHDT